MQNKPILLGATLALSLSLWCIVSGATASIDPPRLPTDGARIDILHYDAQVEPDVTTQTVSGTVRLRFAARAEKLDAMELDCGDLTIDAVREAGETLRFERQGRRLRIRLPRPANAGDVREVEVTYHGAPRLGICFFPAGEQVYTVFSTSHWLVCVDAPEDRATLRLRLSVPAEWRAVANGKLAAQRPTANGKAVYEWRQDAPVPTYTFGFAAGRFREATERHGRVQFRYLGAQFSEAELRRIFRETATMLDFYEERAGMRYADAVYTQVLAAGGVEQEMTGFTVLRETYGREVLADESAVWLGAHEFAHQWWGNRVTCRDWRHFWLNEGMANFMTAAYKERRFGRQAYLREIERSRQSYERVRDKGNDRPLAFPDWDHPTADDRAIVYQKGAYVLHLLREELGEQAFWAGLRQYTRAHFGESVTSEDFQRAMEQASGKSLAEFFNKWVYLK